MKKQKIEKGLKNGRLFHAEMQDSIDDKLEMETDDERMDKLIANVVDFFVDRPGQYSL